MRRIILLLGVTLILCTNFSAAAKTVNEPVVSQEMTVEQLAAINDIKVEQLLKDLKIPDTPQSRSLALSTLEVSDEKAKQAIRKAMVLNAEAKTKDWRKIPLKFALWWLTVILAIYLLAGNRVTRRFRTGQLFISVLIFGVWLGSDPSPMGTVKDTIVLLGEAGTVFPPRVIGFLVFLLMVVAGNKLICGWGCQFGALQDLLYQISPARKRLRIPFAISNSIRTGVFLVFAITALSIPFDFLGVIDPFQIFEPAKLTAAAGAFSAAALLISLVMYRPWCSLACPFGLISWLFERFSWFRVRLQEHKCIGCQTCVASCPSQHAAGLLARAKFSADCYSCGACLEKCPPKALYYGKTPRISISKEPPPKYPATS